MRHLLPLLMTFAAAPAAATAQGNPTDPSTRVILERMRCYGWCPQYRITVNEDGRVQYEGVGYAVANKRLNPSMPLRDSMRIARADVAAVWAAFDAGFSRALPNRFTPGRTDCPFPATDHPTIRLMREGPRRHDTLEVYTGCPVRPSRILHAMATVDSVTNVSHWLGPRTRP